MLTLKHVKVALCVSFLDSQAGCRSACCHRFALASLFANVPASTGESPRTVFLFRRLADFHPQLCRIVRLFRHVALRPSKWQNLQMFEATREPKVPKTALKTGFARSELVRRRIDLHNTRPKFPSTRFPKTNSDPEWLKARRRKRRPIWFAKKRAISTTSCSESLEQKSSN